MKQRNGTIDFFKFIFAIVIVFYHCAQFFHLKTSALVVCGYLAVEFYFIVSGWLLMKRAESEKEENVFNATLKMTGKKYASFFIPLLIAVITSLGFRLYNTHLSAKDVFYTIVLSSSDLFLLQMAKFQGVWTTEVSWYLSALLIISFLIYPILVKRKDLFCKYLAPLFVLFIYGLFSATWGTVDGPAYEVGRVYKGVLRALAGLSLGCIAYCITQKINSATENSLLTNKAFLGTVEVITLFGALAFMLLYRHANTMDYFIILALTFGVAIAFSEKSCLNKIFRGKVFSTLGVYSLSLYLNHLYISSQIPRFFPNLHQNKQMLIYLGLITVVSLFNFFLTLLLRKIIRKYKQRKTQKMQIEN